MKSDKNHKMWNLFLIGVFVASFILVRYVLFELHGMKDWPELLAVVSLVILVLALAKKKTWIALTTGFGYPVSFGLGLLFVRDGTNPGGGRKNNRWFLWTICLLIFIFAGVVAQIVSERKSK